MRKIFIGAQIGALILVIALLGLSCSPRRNPAGPNLTPIFTFGSTATRVVTLTPTFTYQGTQTTAVVTQPVTLTPTFTYQGTQQTIIPTTQVPNSTYTATCTLTHTPTGTTPGTGSVTHTPTRTLTSTATMTVTTTCNGSPDLIITGNWGNCTMPFPVAQCYQTYPNLGTEVFIKNQGTGCAYNFKVKIGTTETTVQNLTAGATAQVWLDTCTSMGDFTITVDSDNTVTESNENNNTYLGNHGSMATAPATCVQNITVTSTPTITNTASFIISHTLTATSTLTATPTLTAVISCLNPKISTMTDCYGETAVFYLTGSSKEAGLNFRVAFYDGADQLVNTINAVSTSGGMFYINDYSDHSGHDISASWHAVLMDGAYAPASVYNPADPAFLDVHTFMVLNYSCPAPTPTLPCANMVRVYNGQSTTFKEFKHILNPCTAFTVSVDYATYDAKIALYDAGNNLVKSELVRRQQGMSSLKMFYAVTGNEAAGIWNIDLFSETDTVPPTRTTGGTLSYCPEGTLRVE